MGSLPEDLVILIFDYKHQLESRAIVSQIKKGMFLKRVDVPARVQFGYDHIAKPLMIRNPETGLLVLNYYWAYFRERGRRPRSFLVRSQGLGTT